MPTFVLNVSVCLVFCRKVRCVGSRKDSVKLAHAIIILLCRSVSSIKRKRFPGDPIENTTRKVLNTFPSLALWLSHTSSTSRSNHFSLNVLICMLLFWWMKRICLHIDIRKQNNSYHQDSFNQHKNVINNYSGLESLARFQNSTLRPSCTCKHFLEFLAVRWGIVPSKLIDKSKAFLSRFSSQ